MTGPVYFYDDYVHGRITLSEFLVGISSYSDPPPATASVGSWTLQGYSSIWPYYYGPGPNGEVLVLYYHYFVPVLTGPGGQICLGTQTLESGDQWVEVGSWSPSVGVSESGGPYRLGVRYYTAGDYRSPYYWSDYGMEFAWFADASTQITSSAGGLSATWWALSGGMPTPGGPQPPADAEPVNLGPVIGGSGFGCFMRGKGLDTPMARFSGLTCGDTTGLHNGSLYGTGGGSAEGKCNAGEELGGSAWWSPSVSVTYAGSIGKFGSAAPDWVQLYDNFITRKVLDQNGTIRSPYAERISFPAANATYTQPIISWENGQKSGWQLAGDVRFSVVGEWAEEQDPQLPATDAAVPIRGPMPDGSANYVAGTVGVIPSLSVHRPEGNRPSVWAPDDVSKVQVVEALADTRITVKDTSGSAARRLTTLWRHYLDKPVRPADPTQEAYQPPLWGTSNYTITKHLQLGQVPAELHEEAPFGEDIWWWNTYAWAKVKITAPAEAAGKAIRLLVDYTRLYVSDPHTTGWDEVEGLEYDFTPGVAEYTLTLDPDQREGDAFVVWVDLLFPNGHNGQAHTLGRVEQLTLSGWPAAGEYRILGFDLVHRYKAYFKLGFGIPVRTPSAAFFDAWRDQLGAKADRFLAGYTARWPVAMLSVDGSFALGEIPDQDRKADETGGTGGSPRYVIPLVGSQSGIEMHSQLDVVGYLGELNKIEGISAVYNKDGSKAARGDQFGAVLGPELAEWLEPIMPGEEFAPGGSVTLYASPTCVNVICPNTHGTTLRVRHHVWGGLEALAVPKDARRPLAVPKEKRPAVYAVCHPYGEDGEPDPNPHALRVEASGVPDDMGYVCVSPVPANCYRNYWLMTREELDAHEKEHPGSVEWRI
jgi:hypothetical protein